MAGLIRTNCRILKTLAQSCGQNYRCEVIMLVILEFNVLGEERRAWSPALVEDLLAVGRYWEKESQFSLNVSPLVHWHLSSERPHIQGYLGRRNCSWLVVGHVRGWQCGWNIMSLLDGCSVPLILLPCRSLRRVSWVLLKSCSFSSACLFVLFYPNWFVFISFFKTFIL